MKKSIFAFALLLTVGLLATACNRTAPLPEDPQVTIPEHTVPETTSHAGTDIPDETLPSAEAPVTESPAEPAPPVLHSGIREDGSFDAGTLFIGDSQTFLFIEHFLKTSGLLGDAKYAVQCGSQVTAFFDTDIRPTVDKNAYYLFSPEFEGLSFCEAAAQMGEEATAIYIMWGTNHTQDATAQNYIDIAAYLLEVCPNATVHLETIPRGDSAYTEVNERIRGAWEHFQSIGEPRVTMVDTFEGIGIYINSDRIHVDPQGREGWYNALVLHAETLGLAQ